MRTAKSRISVQSCGVLSSPILTRMLLFLLTIVCCVIAVSFSEYVGPIYHLCLGHLYLVLRSICANVMSTVVNISLVMFPNDASRPTRS